MILTTLSAYRKKSTARNNNKRKNHKRKDNDHGTTDQIAQGKAIKFATNQSGGRKITRAAPKANEQKTST